VNHAGGLVAHGAIASASGNSLTGTASCVQSVSAQPGMLVWGTDDSAALARAMTAAMARAGTDGNAPLYVPPGQYYLSQTPLPVITRVPVGITGAGQAASVFIVDPSFPGTAYQSGTALFGWAGLAEFGIGGKPASSNTGVSNGLVSIGGFSIIGNRQADHEMTALAFLDVVKGAHVHDVNVTYWPGSVVQTGGLFQSGNVNSYLIESQFENVHSWQSGMADAPVFDFNDTGHGDSDNTNTLRGIGIFFPYGDGLVFRSNTSVNPERLFVGDAIRIENTQPGHAAVRVGDTQEDGGVPGSNIYGIQLSHLQIITTQHDATGILVEAQAGSKIRRSFGLTFQGMFINNQKGSTCIVVTNGDQIHFDFDEISGPVNVVNNHGTVVFTGLGIGYHLTKTHFDRAMVEVPSYTKLNF
jgi:hypothetical protein